MELEGYAVSFDEADVGQSLCRETFFEFLKEFWPEVSSEQPVWNWHTWVLCYELQKAAERVFAGVPNPHDYVINVPPGTTKSTIVSEMFPAWCWTRRPDLQFICGSHTMDIARDLARRSKDVIQSEKYKSWFGVPSPDGKYKAVVLANTATEMIINTEGGFRLAVGAGHVLGFHGHFILVDDPIDPESASSVLDRETAVKWMSETLSTRKVNKIVSVTILVMQRLAVEDPSGLMLGQIRDKRWGTPVRHICLPWKLSDQVRPEKLRAYYDKKTKLLDPIRLPEKVALEYKIRMGKYGFACQMEQNPIPVEGNLIAVHKFKYLQNLPPTTLTHYKKIVRYWDKAGTHEGGKRTAGVKLGIDNHDRVVILDVVIGQWSAGEREAVIKSVAGKDGRDVQIGVEQEPGSGGKESAEATVQRLMGYVCEIELPTGDKAWRADPFAAQADIGNVYLPDGAPWIPEYVEELRYFPEGTFSDQTDATSGAFNMAAGDNVHMGALFRKK